MTGHNHFPDCLCAWCVGGWGNHPTTRLLYESEIPARWPKRPTFETFTIPNAFCPVCGESVFFYSSPFGGRVYFDALGPPWPKHPCTDRTRASLSITTRKVVNAAGSWAWQKAEWHPILIERVSHQGVWTWIEGRRIDNGRSFFRATPLDRRITIGGPAQATGFDQFGIGKLSIVTLEEIVIIESLLVHRNLGNTTPDDILKSGDGDHESAHSIGISILNLYNSDTIPKNATYSKFIDKNLIRHWFEFAAHLGSARAKVALAHPFFRRL